MKNPVQRTFAFLFIASFSILFLACPNPISSNPVVPSPSAPPVVISSAPTVVLPIGDTSVTVIADSAIAAPSVVNGNFKPIGKVYEISLQGKSGPISFAPNYAVLSFPYDKASIKSNGLLEEFSVFYFDTGISAWKAVDKVEVDYANSRIKAYTTHFTAFVATAALEQPTGVQPPPSGILADYPSGIGGSGHAAFSLLGEGYLYYQDRAYTIKPLSASTINTATFSALGFEGAMGISTTNGGTVADPYSAHKLFEGDNYISFTAKRDLDVYVMYDTRGGSGPNDITKDAPWLATYGFTANISTPTIPTPARYFVETTDAVGQYTVYKKTYAANAIVQLDGNRKGVTDPGIQTNYWVIIKAKDNYSSNSASDVSVSPSDKIPPAEVSSLVANSADGGVRLSWVAPSDADFTKVIITYSPGAVAPYILAKGTNTADISGLTNGTVYTFKVRTVDSSNNMSQGISTQGNPNGARVVRYDPNGSVTGTSPIDSTIYANGDLVSVLGNTGNLVKPNYVFSGWSLTPNGSAIGSSFTIGSVNVSLYAVWVQLAQWARAAVSSTDQNEFSSVVSDSAGNTYSVGYIAGTGAFNFGGNSSPVSGTAVKNAVIVKYSAAGIAQWAHSVVSGTSPSQFNGIAIDNLGNLITVGFIWSNAGVNFGGPNGSVVGTSAVYSTIIVKYDPSGIAQWAQTVSSGPASCQFNAVAVDGSGNAYAVGTIDQQSMVNFGGLSNTIIGSFNGYNALIVKYNSAGIAQWAQTTGSGAHQSQFTGVAADSSGNIFAVGAIQGIGDYSFGGISSSLLGTSLGDKAIIVKYSSAGEAQWGKAENSGYSTFFRGISVDSSGSCYAIGLLFGTGNCDFGGVSNTVTGIALANPLIVKFSSTGIAQWAKTLVSGNSQSDCEFTGVGIDGLGNIYVSGWIATAGSYNFGGKNSLITINTGWMKPIIVKYNSTGITQWAQSPNSESTTSRFNCVAADSMGNSYVAGFFGGNSVVDFGGNTNPIQGFSIGSNAVIVRINSF